MLPLSCVNFGRFDGLKIPVATNKGRRCMFIPGQPPIQRRIHHRSASAHTLDPEKGLRSSPDRARTLSKLAAIHTNQGSWHELGSFRAVFFNSCACAVTGDSRWGISFFFLHCNRYPSGMGVEAMGQTRGHAGEDRADGASLLKMKLLLIHTVVHTLIR